MEGARFLYYSGKRGSIPYFSLIFEKRGSILYFPWKCGVYSIFSNLKKGVYPAEPTHTPFQWECTHLHTSNRCPISALCHSDAMCGDGNSMPIMLDHRSTADFIGRRPLLTGNGQEAFTGRIRKYRQRRHLDNFDFGWLFFQPQRLSK